MNYNFHSSHTYQKNKIITYIIFYVTYSFINIYLIKYFIYRFVQAHLVLFDVHVIKIDLQINYLNNNIIN